MKVRLGRISYTNVLPVYWGFRDGNIPPFLDITAAPPRTLNRMMANSMLDISPVSSISYARNCNDWLIVPGLSISAGGPVMSVLLLSRMPLDKLSDEKIILSEESEASVELLKLCFQNRNVFPRFQQGRITSETLHDPGIAGTLVIGDQALRLSMKKHDLHITDLGSCWMEWTGKPFVFGLWAVRKQFAAKDPALVSHAIEALRTSLAEGLASLSAISAQASEELGIARENMETYFRGLSYALDEEHAQGLQLFFRYSRKRGFLKEPVSLSYFQDVKNTSSRVPKGREGDSA